MSVAIHNLADLDNRQLPHGFNETLWNLEAITNPFLKGINESTVPASPQVGDSYHVGQNALNEWAGLRNYIVTWNGGRWSRTQIQAGYTAVVASQGTKIFTGQLNENPWVSLQDTTSFAWQIPNPNATQWSDQDQGLRGTAGYSTTQFYPLLPPSVSPSFFSGRAKVYGSAGDSVTFTISDVLRSAANSVGFNLDLGINFDSRLWGGRSSPNGAFQLTTFPQPIVQTVTIDAGTTNDTTLSVAGGSPEGQVPGDGWMSCNVTNVTGSPTLLTIELLAFA